MRSGSARLSDVTGRQDIRTLVRLPLGARLAVFAGGVGVLWVAALLGERHLPIDLTVVLLLALTFVLALAVVVGPVLGILTGLIAVVLVNWYLVPPYGTFEVASPDNVVALVVFALVSGAVAILAEVNARVQAGAVRSRERALLLADVVTKADDADPRESLERVREALALDRISLVRDGEDRDEVLATAGNGPVAAEAEPALDVRVGSYRLVGSGPARMAEDPASSSRSRPPPCAPTRATGWSPSSVAPSSWRQSTRRAPRCSPASGTTCARPSRGCVSRSTRCATHTLTSTTTPPVSCSRRSTTPPRGSTS